MFIATKTILLIGILFICCTAKAQRFSVLIHEVMADPQPVVGLPDAEYVELKNKSSAPVQLKGWRLQTASAVSGAFPDFILQPDSFIVVTSRNNAALFVSPAIGISSFPTLSNTGTTLALINDTGAVVHAVAYIKSWYGDAAKEEGGWSLEMIDAANPCGGANNWRASADAAGGTPGRANAVAANNRDETPPVLIAAILKDSTTLLLQFSEGLQQSSTTPQNILRISPTVSIGSIEFISPLYNQLAVQLQQPLQPQTLYTITVGGVADCAGNEIGIYNKAQTGLPQSAVAGDVAINEILFNPRTDGADYVELYNRSNKVIDMSSLRTKGSSNAMYDITDEPFYLLPQAYVVLTENQGSVLRHYLVKKESAVLEVSALPSLPDDAGSFALLDKTGNIMDALTYKDDWHHALVADATGVALERIDADKPTQDKMNWTSASATAGFGTPTYQNSQQGITANTQGALDILPKTFSPDGDGFADVCTINFTAAGSGWVANLRLLDASGREVRHLVKSETLSASNAWRWDGLGEGGKLLPAGAYVVWLEAFNLQDKKQAFKKVVVLAKK